MKKILSLAGVLVLLTHTSCNSEKHEKKENVNFVVTSPIIQDTTISKEYVCQIHAIQHIEIRALEKGYLQNIYVDEGQVVKEGQLMFRIMPILYNAEVSRAKAEADLAEIEYKNTKALADSNIVSKNELAMAKAKFDKAKAQLQLAEAHLGFTEIKAPFTGIMDKFHVRLGSLLDEGDLLTTLSDNSKMWVYFNVPEAEYLDYKSSVHKDSLLKVKLQMANLKMYPFTGVVETIEADFNNQTGNIAFRATFANPDLLLRHGETGNIIVDKTLEDALIIPQKATFEVLNKKYVYVVDKDDIVRPRVVEVAEELPDLYVIRKGLKVDDKILLEGLRLVEDNQKIKYTFEDPKKVMKSLKLYAE